MKFILNGVGQLNGLCSIVKRIMSPGSGVNSKSVRPVRAGMDRPGPKKNDFPACARDTRRLASMSTATPNGLTSGVSV